MKTMKTDAEASPAGRLFRTRSPGPTSSLVPAAALMEWERRSTPTRTGSAGRLWRPAELAGRLCELASDPHGVHLTLACALIRSFQQAAEPVAWVTASRATFFPPDAAHCGVDLAALPVITVPGPEAVLGVADRLTRCGAFGLIVLELGAHLDVPAAILGRLARLARCHDTALLCLTTPESEITLGSLVALRGRGFRTATRHPGSFHCGIRVLKDRRRGPGRSLAVTCHAPYGMC
ncbi:MAG: hypothetical protein OXH96_03850 [Spirochaetaceae bacterium]|nr:hypothetical protein [Spirochaetaceae bacterium]